MEIEHMSEGLTRQRRNLISISCILIFLKFAGVEIAKLSFLGIDFGKIGNPSAIYLGIWIFYFYFLIRYYQYFTQEGKPRLIKYYYDCTESYVQKHCDKLAKGFSDRASYFPQQLRALEADKWNLRITYPNGEDGLGGTKTEIENLEFPRKQFRQLQIKSLTKIFLNTSAVSDYIFPFILAITVLIYCYDNANSSLIMTLRNGLT